MSRRTNQQWLDDLKGQNGPGAQRLALKDLNKYLIKVAYNALLSKLEDPALAGELCTDFANETIELICGHQFAKLQQYNQTGRFLGWVGVICNRIVLRAISPPKFSLMRATEVDYEESFQRMPDERQQGPEETAITKEIETILKICLDKLKKQQRIALDTLLEGLSGEEAAVRVGAKSANSVYTLVYRGKEQLKKCLAKAGIDESALQNYA